MFKKSLLGIVAVSAFATSSAKAEVVPYVGVYGHRTIAEYNDHATKAKFDDKAYGFSLSAGINYSDFSTELEYFQTDKFKDNFYLQEDRLKAKAVMLSQYYNFINDTAFTPYIGAGISMGRINLGYVGNGAKNLSKLGVHAGVGVQYELSDNLALDLGYRYMDFGHAESHINNLYHKTHVKLNDFYLGLTFNFGSKNSTCASSVKEQKKVVSSQKKNEEKEKVVRKIVVGTTATPAVVAAANTNSKVKAKDMKLIPSMFGTASSKLSQARKDKLTSALADFKGEKNIRFNIYGYTDRVGSVAYNNALSKRRAEAVADVFRSNGFGKQIQKVEGRGPTNSIVGKACDKVKGAELSKCLAADRRVEIDVVEK